jgi:peptidoglycan/LPS O-acetylase OafA/YrhL
MTAGERKKVSVSRFFINRFTNLYPIHIITLILTVALMTVNSRPFDVELSNLDSAPPIIHTMSMAEVEVNAILQILLLQAWNPFYLSFNIPSWSLSTLFFFYLLFPATAPRLLSMRRKCSMLTAMWVASLLPVIIVVVNGWYGVWTIGVLHINPLIRLPEFLAGILAYGIFAEHAQQITGLVARHRRILIGTLAALFIGAAYLFAEGPPFLGSPSSQRCDVAPASRRDICFRELAPTCVAASCGLDEAVRKHFVVNLRSANAAFYCVF